MLHTHLMKREMWFIDFTGYIGAFV